MTAKATIDQAAPPLSEHPTYHTTGQSIAAMLMEVAARLETLGDNEFAKTWCSLSLQVSGTNDPDDRKEAVDTIASVLGLTPATGGTTDSYGTGLPFFRVYTAQLHQPGCCKHCTLAGA